MLPRVLVWARRRRRRRRRSLLSGQLLYFLFLALRLLKFLICFSMNKKKLVFYFLLWIDENVKEYRNFISLFAQIIWIFGSVADLSSDSPPMYKLNSV